MERLALDGGIPVRKTMLNYARQWVDQDDIEAVVKVLQGDWLTTGPSVREFEDAVAYDANQDNTFAIAPDLLRVYSVQNQTNLGYGGISQNYTR